MVKIDFVIVGAAKSGTTSLHRYLAQHPDIFMPQAKELAYFHTPLKDKAQRALIERYYAKVEPGQTVGLSEANMLFFPQVPKRIRAHNPNARILAVLRNPIERAYSGYWFARTRGWESCSSFEEALAREMSGDLISRYDRINFTYLEHGHYAKQLDGFLEIFEPGRLRVLLTEDLADQASKTMKRVLAWLEVDERLNEIALHRRYNVTSQARFPKAGAFLAAGALPAKVLSRNLLSISSRTWLQDKVIRPLRALNRKAFTPPTMHRETRERLREHYRDHNARLERLLDRDLSHWV